MDVKDKTVKQDRTLEVRISDGDLEALLNDFIYRMPNTGTARNLVERILRATGKV